MKTMSVRKLTFAAMVAAAYAALTMLLPSYTPLQLRISEALCILPFFFPFTTWGLFVGCLIANLLSPYGWADVVFGSLATLASCACVAAIGKRGDRMSTLRCALACLMPVIFNMFIIGAVIAFTSAQSADAIMSIFLVSAAELFISEAGTLFIIGLPLMKLLPRSGFFNNAVQRLA